MRISLLTPPGIAKFNISERISEKYSIPIISLKDLLLQEVNSGSELGLDIKKQIDNSKPVSNDNIISIMTKAFEDEFYSDGFLLDGLPCNKVQAEALDNILAKRDQGLQGLIFLHLDYDKLMEFMTGQLSCRSCSKEFNIYFNPPYLDKVCDDCGGKLYQRADDREETISRRIRDFEAYLDTLKEYYNSSLLKIIVTGIDSDLIFKLSVKAVDSCKENFIQTTEQSDSVNL